VPFRIRISLYILAFILAALLIVPLLVPVPPLEGLRPYRELAWPGSSWVRVRAPALGSLELHLEVVQNGEPQLASGAQLSPADLDRSLAGSATLLLHGFGANTRTWSRTLDLWSADGTAVAFDRPAFGLSERPLGPFPRGANPYAPNAQVAAAVGILDALELERAVLVGHSAGGTIALQTALQHPERVAALVLVAPAVYAGGGSPTWARPLLQTPQLSRVGPLIARQFGGEQGEAFLRASWFNPALLDDEVLAAYRHPLQVENWDRALWELVKASAESDLAARLAEVRVPVLIITGAQDSIVPPEQSRRLVVDLTGVPGGAEYVELEGCGHLPHEECVEAFRDAVGAWWAVR
jgi:pimeloyl-ACP methyl ester carboxylesterase